MKSLVYTKLSIALLSTALVFSGCQKKGDPGPAGATGVDGTGFAEAAKNGNILVYVDGTLPSGVAYNDTLNFKFSSDDLGYSEVHGNNNDLVMNIKRYLTFDNYEESESDDPYFYLQMNPEIDGESGDTTYYFDGNFRASLTSANYHYLQSYVYFYNTDGSNFTNEHFEGFKFDSSTGHLYFRFSFTIPEENYTNHDMNIHGIVDVTLFKSLDF